MSERNLMLPFPPPPATLAASTHCLCSSDLSDFLANSGPLATPLTASTVSPAFNTRINWLPRDAGGGRGARSVREPSGAEGGQGRRVLCRVCGWEGVGRNVCHSPYANSEGSPRRRSPLFGCPENAFSEDGLQPSDHCFLRRAGPSTRNRGFDGHRHALHCARRAYNVRGGTKQLQQLQQLRQLRERRREEGAVTAVTAAGSEEGAGITHIRKRGDHHQVIIPSERGAVRLCAQ